MVSASRPAPLWLALTRVSWRMGGLAFGLVSSAAAQVAPASNEARVNDTAATAPKPSIVAPRFLSGPEPIAPARVSESVAVVLAITVDDEGRVTMADVLESGGADFDAAAVDATRASTFEPATRDGVKVAARVRFEVRFDPPPEPARPPEPAPVEPVAPAQNPDSHLEVTVHGERPLRTEQRAASDYFVHREVLEAAPHQEGMDALRAVPGLTIFRTEGLAVAPSYSLRGFNSEHGQDIEFIVGGLPLNLPSHLHGQGYADLGFLVGEVVDELRVSAGVSDPKQGDFAVAGSIEIGLGVDEERRGLQIKSSYGSFGTYRQLLAWAPKEAARESLGAVQYSRTDGFGQNRAGESASGLLQHRFGEGPVTYRFIGLAHMARADSAGVVRRDDVESGRVCFHCVYDLPTAQAQNGLAQRLMAGFFADYRGPEHASGSVGLWLGHDNFRVQENNTGFLGRSQTLAGVSGRGDLIEQRNRTSSVGLTGRYRTEAFEPAEFAHGTLEVGTDSRLDFIDQEQNLLDGSLRNQTWDRRVDASIAGMDVGFYGDLDWEFAEIVRFRLGARADVLSYEVEDRLGNFVPAVRPDDAYIQGHRRSALGVAAGPRTSIEVRPIPRLSLLASYGEGYRSPQARLLEDGEKAPFTKVHSGDVGFKWRFGEPLELSGAAFYTRLSDDVAFDAAEGRLERVGATERLGGTLYLLAHPASWMLTSVSVTYVNAVLIEPPPPTASEPAPPFTAGQALPYVPPLVARADWGVRHPIARWGENDVLGRAGVGLSFLSPRPLPFGETALPVGLLDASVGVDWGPMQLSLEGFNLLDRSWAASEYQFVSNWDPSGVPSRIPARHVAAGAPLSFLVTLGVTL